MPKTGLSFPGTSNPQLARKIAKLSKQKLGKVEIKKFSDSETYVNIKENIKNKNVSVTQPCSIPANENLTELLIIIDAAKRFKPKKITAVIPFYPYRRQERKIEPGESVTAELVAKLIETAGANKVVTVELHSEKIKSFFKIPITHLRTLPLFVDYFRKKFSNLENYVVVAPDMGAKEQSEKLAKALKTQLAVVTKSRPEHDKVKIEELSNNVAGKHVIILDDEINTAGTICQVARALKEHGARNIYVAATHGIFSADAIQKIERAPIKEVVTTDTIAWRKKAKSRKIRIISVAGLISEVIK
jgi:ribose-phosphate pyrophosphokinase